MKKSIFIISFIFLFAGCSTTHMTKIDKAPDLTTESNEATLVIFRDTYFGGAIVFWNYLDDKLIGETKGKTYFVTSVAYSAQSDHSFRNIVTTCSRVL